MTFVYPLLLGGLVLAGLPVLLHFLIRKKPVTLLFPAYRFLMQKKKSNTRNLRLRHFLLLLLRILLIAIICFALSRPRLFHEAVGLSREKPVALVLIFDTTPSMEYQSGAQTRLDLAKTRALELLDQLPENCRVLILDAAHPAGFGREDWLKSLDKARQRIQSLTIGPESAPVNAALDEAYRRFENWDDPESQRFPRFVCVFSDRTRASWDFTAGAKRGADVQFLYFDVGIDEPIDLAITHAELGGTRQTFLAGEKVPLTVVAHSTGQKIVNTLVVQVNDKKLEQIVPLDPGIPQTLAFEIDPTAWDLKPGLHQAEVKFESETDSWSRNNKRFVTFKIDPKPRVLVLTDDLQKTSEFARALELLNFEVVHRIANEKFEECVAVFLVGVAAPSDLLWAKLSAHVEAGRGVCIILPGDSLKKPAYNSEAAQMVMPAKVQTKIDGPPREWNHLFGAELAHPFLAPYRKWLTDDVEYDFITNPRTASRYWRVDTDKGIVNFVGTKDAAIIESVSGKQSGKVLLLTTPMDDQAGSWNNYYDKVKPLFYLSLTYLCARHLCVEPESMTFNHQFGQKMPTATKTLAFPKYVLTSGDFVEEIRFDDKDRWTAERLLKEGNFTVSGTNLDEPRTETIHKFSMNIVPEESDLTRVSVADIEGALGKNSVVPQDRRRSIVETLGDSWDEPVELLPWLMIALLFMLALENLLANKFYKSEPDA